MKINCECGQIFEIYSKDCVYMDCVNCGKKHFNSENHGIRDDGVIFHK